MHLCSNICSVVFIFYLFDSIFSRIVWIHKLHEFDEGISFPNNGCNGGRKKTIFHLSFQIVAMRKMVSGKLPLGKLSPRKLPPPQENWPPESCPLLKYPPMNIPLYECSPCENYPPEICPLEKITPMNSPPHLEIIQMKEKPKLQKLLLRRKLCNTKALGKHQNNQGLLWYSDDLTENTGLRYFLYKMKKIQKSKESENRRMAFTCQLYKSRRTKTRQSNYKIW